MTEEQWRPWRSGDYEVSDRGRVRRARDGRRTYAGRLMRPVLLKIGYLIVAPTVCGKNEHHYIHEMVSECFIGPRPDGMDINHRSGVKTDNSVANLEYVSHSENMAHASRIGLLIHGEDHPSSKLTDSLVRELRALRSSGMSFSKLASHAGVCISVAFNAVTGKTWRHVA